ncbi:MAG: hypothetical protein U5L72_03600 [Bacteroidales bacterium]|nr:hypothetical protein [Bacteroidales bacterium]
MAWVHFYSAASFFVILALISLFLFTRGEKHPTGRKLKRNTVYRVCGIIMLVALAAMQIFFSSFMRTMRTPGLLSLQRLLLLWLSAFRG